MSLNGGGLVDGDTRKVDPQQLTQMKENLINEINSILKQKVKDNRAGGLPGTSVNDLKDLKQSFDNDLKNNFDGLNDRIKKVEDNLSDIWKKKANFMETVKMDLSSNINNQERYAQKELSELKRLVDSKFDENSVRQIVSGNSYNLYY